MTEIAYLGPAGTYSEVAALSLGIDDVQPLPCVSIPEVFEAVERGKAVLGVVPIENSIEGSVVATLDALVFDTTLEIQRELVLDIHFSLVAAPGTKLAGITSVVAHPQAGGQCRRWLERNLPGRPVTAANSNAEAVQTAVANPGVAALGPVLAAEIYGAEVIEDGVQDYAGNQTRFVVIGHGLQPRSGKDKTSLALFMKKDKPGALLMILSEFAYADINLTKIQSRPTKRQLGDYMFFVDLEGHVDDPEVRLALDCLRLKLREVKVLGSYPVAR
ncbi:MAG: prephenate dehydratase [Actinobacteria bacterium]|nr:prephenate dehydratase [Actinomycetota bacterium]